MRYCVDLEADDDGYTVSFPDIPEALTGGATREEALDMAADALATAAEFYFEDRRMIPLPRAIPAAQHSVRLPASLTAKILLLNELLLQDVTPSELARRMGARPQEVNRLLKAGHTTKIDTIERALHALGKEMVITVHT